MGYRTMAELEVGLEEIRRSPADEGTLHLVVRRPAEGEREVVPAAELDVDQGMIGDTWLARGSKRMPDGSADREAQITLMNSRVAALLSGGPEGWGIAGDQLYLDLDLSEGNLPPGTRLGVGDAVLEVSAIPHTGCLQFSQRFGPDALRWASTPVGREMRLRGVNTRIVQGGTVSVGDAVRKDA